MEQQINEISVNGVDYVRKDSININEMAEKTDNMEYCVIRTYSAGVHIGYVKRHEGQEVELVNSRRLWSWSDGASLSQVAIDGCKSDKFAVILPKIILTDVIEIISCTEKAKNVLEALPEWKK
ncbi:hypothetical protein KAR91_23885 [Candidatus Pacearchaeota archaeon]|nr:hypothetical protein [Candidatus Pacearchaeota archaeon]